MNEIYIYKGKQILFSTFESSLKEIWLKERKNGTLIYGYILLYQ